MSNRGGWMASAMILLATVAVLKGATGLQQWRMLALGSAYYFGVSLVAGAGLWACAAALFTGKLAGKPATLWGFVFAVALFANHAYGMWQNTLLCTGPY
jgi:hypothetical protein